MNSQVETAPSRLKRYLKFCGLSVAITVLLALLGWKPTENLAGESGVVAMLAGCGISLLASLLGALPVAFGSMTAAMATTWTLASTAIRLAVAVLGAVGLLLSGWFLPLPLLLWVALSHLALLAVDTRFALRAARRLTTLEEE
jgi:hypothetical protein